MPPAATKLMLSRGDPGYHGKHARKTEQKRYKKQMACAECTRRKIKCDKQIPCQSCQRRGCVALCPNGILTTGEGTRSIVAATEHLYRWLGEKNERISQLEDALSELHAKHSTEPHPLLRPDPLGASQRENNVGPPFASDPAVVEHTPELVETMGTLFTSASGASRFFGPTGGSYCLLMIDDVSSQDCADGPSDLTRDLKYPGVPREIEDFTLAFLFESTHSTWNIESLINDYLPTWDRALYLTEAYLEQATSLFQSVSEDQISSELLPAYYVNGVPHVQQAENPHQLALLFLVFAIAALLSANQEPGNVEAECYHKVACTAIRLQSVTEKPSLETIQALHLLSIYNTVSGDESVGKETSMETSWSLVAVAAYLANTLGLHRDSHRWDLSADITERRRMVFWDLFVADVWNCLEAGRPPTFSPSYIDCRFPGGGSPNENVHTCSYRQDFCKTWAFRFASSCVADVAARVLASDSPSYSAILELDRKVRDFPVSETAKCFAAAASGAFPAKAADEDVGLMKSMSRFVMSNAREILLLYIHQSYFAHAIIDNPIDPLSGPYSQSFRAAYRASLTILRTVKVQYGLYPNLTARLWPMWTSVLSAAIVFGKIVTRAPRSPMASGAMKELSDACLLFSEASSHSRRAQKALPIITRLTEKAQNALLHAQSDVPNESGHHWGVDENEGDNELDIFAGRMKILSMKRHMTDEMSSGTAFVSQHKQNQVEPLVVPTYSGEEFSTWPRRPGSVTSLEQTREIPACDWTPYPDTSSQSTQTLPHRSTQAPVETVELPSCSGEELGRARLQQPSFAASPGQIREVSTWDWTLHPDTSSQSTTLLQTPHVSMQTLVEPVVLPPYRGEELGSTRFLQPGTAVGLSCRSHCNYLPMCHQKRQHMVSSLRDHPRVHGRPSHLIRTRWPMLQLSARRPILKDIIRLMTGTTNTGIVLRPLLRRRLYRIMITLSLPPTHTITKAGLSIIQYIHFPASISPHTRIHPNTNPYHLPRPNSPSTVPLHKSRDLISIGYRPRNSDLRWVMATKVDMNYLHCTTPFLFPQF
ncbi:fungal-specific transcription factor domain-containing protein [Pisolithus croceorrhizus]|nr:fungal-specific transcription factor domain-containing protein [Pisolithus croceorrhizus]